MKALFVLYPVSALASTASLAAYSGTLAVFKMVAEERPEPSSRVLRPHAPQDSCTVADPVLGMKRRERIGRNSLWTRDGGLFAGGAYLEDWSTAQAAAARSEAGRTVE